MHQPEFQRARESRQARSLLARLQAAREAREKDPAATDRAAWSEHCTIGLMTDALADTPPASVAPAEPAAPPPAPVAEPAAPEPPSGAAPARDLAADAELYAIMYPRRARLIRALGGLPDNPDFGPPDPELVPCIAAGTTPALLALDAEFLARAPMPADAGHGHLGRRPCARASAGASARPFRNADSSISPPSSRRGAETERQNRSRPIRVACNRGCAPVELDLAGAASA